MLQLFIADDSKAVRDHVSEWVSGIEGIEVVGEADTVPGAIEGIRRLKPDLVILDIRMPGGTGMDVLVGAREEQSASTLVMFSQMNGAHYRRAFLQAGAEAYFHKGTECGALVAFVRRFAERAVAKPAA
jgi:DNA-binding NarL/FixJ family response regulator